MALRSLSHAGSGTILVGALIILGACGDRAANSEAPTGDDTAPVILTVASLSPEDLILRALGCRMSLNRARQITARLPVDVAQSLTSAPDLSFLALIEKGGELGLSTQDRQKAAGSVRPAPTENEPVTEDYLAYIEECAAIAVRAASILPSNET